MLTQDIDCTPCPNLCCYAHSRPPEWDFLHPTLEPAMCHECVMESKFWCKIHNKLRNDSPECDWYTCFGVWSHLARILNLNPHEIASMEVQKNFLERQAIALLLIRIPVFLKTYNNPKYQSFRTFFDKWHDKIFWDDTRTKILAYDFHVELNQIMKDLSIWITKINKRFVPL